MLARSAPMPAGAGWAVEVKFDGMRLQLRHDGHAVCLRSRPGRNCSEEFPGLAAITGVLGRRRVLLDGELVCLGADGNPDFASLRRRLRAPADKALRHAERAPATFFTFDLLHLDGRSTRELPYERRRELLLDLALDAPCWRTPRHFIEQIDRVLAATDEHGLEGVVAKRLGSLYLPGTRNGAWVKHKHRRTESFLVSAGRHRSADTPRACCSRERAPMEASSPLGASPSCSPTARPTTCGDSSRRCSCRRLGAVSTYAGLSRSCGPLSRSTARCEGRCVIRFSAPSITSRSSRWRRSAGLGACVLSSGSPPGYASSRRFLGSIYLS
jgi:hypothetical protein